MSTILLPLPATDFDPTEAAIPWQVLTERGHTVQFATPDGRPAQADARMLHGHGLGPLAPLLVADRRARAAYAALAHSAAFGAPLAYAALDPDSFDGLVLPGGHAPGMRPYLQSATIQSVVAAFFQAAKPVGAICHGVLVAARTRAADGRSVLYGRQTTALTRGLELGAWALTAAWLGRYYRTYSETVETEVRTLLARPADFHRGPLPWRRDQPADLARGFVVQDGTYLSARWPGDAHRFATTFAAMLPRR